MSWRIVYAGLPQDSDQVEYEDHAQATCAIVFRLGVATLSEYTPDGEFAVRSCENNEIVARIVPVGPTKLVYKPARYPALRRWHGLSWVGWVNFVFLRWFLVRLYYQVDELTGERIGPVRLRWWPSWRW